MATTRIAVASTPLTTTLKEATPAAIAAVREAGRLGARIVCLPETGLPGHRCQARPVPKVTAAALDDALSAIALASRDAGVVTIVGAERPTRAGLEIVTVVLDADGTWLGEQVKTQIDPYRGCPTTSLAPAAGCSPPPEPPSASPSVTRPSATRRSAARSSSTERRSSSYHTTSRPTTARSRCAGATPRIHTTRRRSSAGRSRTLCTSARRTSRAGIRVDHRPHQPRGVAAGEPAIRHRRGRRGRPRSCSGERTARPPLGSGPQLLRDHLSRRRGRLRPGVVDHYAALCRVPGGFPGVRRDAPEDRGDPADPLG